MGFDAPVFLTVRAERSGAVGALFGGEGAGGEVEPLFRVRGDGGVFENLVRKDGGSRLYELDSPGSQ